MRLPLAAALLIVAAGVPVSAHRLDEYLQGTIISVEKNRLQAQMTLTPGVLFSSADCIYRYRHGQSDFGDGAARVRRAGSPRFIDWN